MIIFIKELYILYYFLYHILSAQWCCRAGTRQNLTNFWKCFYCNNHTYICTKWLCNDFYFLLEGNMRTGFFKFSFPVKKCTTPLHILSLLYHILSNFLSNWLFYSSFTSNRDSSFNFWFYSSLLHSSFSLFYSFLSVKFFISSFFFIFACSNIFVFLLLI